VNETIEFLVRHGESVLFVAVLAEQVGLPIPAIPVLLAAGALAGAGKMNASLAVGLALAACLVGDVIWYELGRHRGRHVLNVLCRIALEPDSCVRRTENVFTRHGVRSLIIAKFIPGLSTVAPALAGLFGVSLERFLLYNGLGALVWIAAFVVPGYVFSGQLERIAEEAARLGGWLMVVLGGSLAAYIVYKYIHRQHLLRSLRIARISPEELKRMMDAGHEPVIVDLRQSLDLEADPYTIPGALRLTVDELERRHHEIPRDRDVVLFCACPNEVTSARMAILLRRNGIMRVRPLAGGIDAWRAQEFPLEGMPVA
jgi:membrane protein DedA with SNARE-associated domain/rhodanese-related sulfurtransferase